MLSRRNFLLAAPAVIISANLMPIRGFTMKLRERTHHFVVEPDSTTSMTNGVTRILGDSLAEVARRANRWKELHEFEMAHDRQVPVDATIWGMKSYDDRCLIRDQMRVLHCKSMEFPAYGPRWES